LFVYPNRNRVKHLSEEKECATSVCGPKHCFKFALQALLLYSAEVRICMIPEGFRAFSLCGIILTVLGLICLTCFSRC